MPKVKSLPDRIARAMELAVRARIPLDLFRFLSLQDNLNRYEDVLSPYWDFFRFDRTAQEASFHIRINNLLTRKPDTDNLPDLLDELRAESLIDAVEADRLCAVLDRINPIRKGVRHVRNKAIAHQDDTLSSPEVYATAQLTLDRLLELSDATLEVANGLCAASGVAPQTFVTYPVERLIELLEALRPKRPGPLKFLD